MSELGATGLDIGLTKVDNVLKGALPTWVVNHVSLLILMQEFRSLAC